MGMSVYRMLTRIDNAIDENVTRYQTIVVLVHFTEQICQT